MNSTHLISLSLLDDHTFAWGTLDSLRPHLVWGNFLKNIILLVELAFNQVSVLWRSYLQPWWVPLWSHLSCWEGKWSWPLKSLISSWISHFEVHFTLWAYPVENLSLFMGLLRKYSLEAHFPDEQFTLEICAMMYFSFLPTAGRV